MGCEIRIRRGEKNGGHNNDPKGVRPLTPGTKMAYRPKGNEAAEGIKITSQQALRLGDYLGLSRCAWCK